MKSNVLTQIVHQITMYKPKLLIVDLVEVGGEMKVELLTFPLVCEYQ